MSSGIHQREVQTIDFLVVLHEQERIVVQVAIKVNVRSDDVSDIFTLEEHRCYSLYPPIPLVLKKERMSIEELTDRAPR